MPIKDLIYMAGELSDFLDERGYEAFLRQKGTQRCHCWDELTKTFDRECPSCGSFGYTYTDKKIRTRKSFNTTSTYGAYRTILTPMGESTVDEATFYFESITQTDVNPSTNDWIVECKTKADGTLWAPYLIERAWSINEVQDLRDQTGQLSFFAARCRRLAFGK